MPENAEIWKLVLSCTKEQEPIIDEAFAEDSVASSSLITDQEDCFCLEILFQGKPPLSLIDDKLNQIATRTNSSTPTYTLSSIGNLDWIKKVAEQLEPMTIARWTVFGAAFAKDVHDKTLGIQIDATSAFGTGEHPTTRGCLLMLDTFLQKRFIPPHARMLDMGCGSGILGMAFARATGGRALGIDMDANSVEIAKHNLSTNGLSDMVRIECGVGYAAPAVAEQAPYDLIMANVFADPLCDMAADLRRHLKSGGYAILSGILNDQAERVVAAHQQQGLTLIEKRQDGEWSVLALTLSRESSCGYDSKQCPSC